MAETTNKNNEGQVRVVKPAKGWAARNQQRIIRVFLPILFLLLLVIILVALFNKPSKSQQVINKLNHIENSTGCDKGIKDVGSNIESIRSSSSYSNSAKEKALNYLMTCNFELGNTSAANKYADLLKDLYKKDNNFQQLDKLNQFITYMNNYGLAPGAQK